MFNYKRSSVKNKCWNSKHHFSLQGYVYTDAIGNDIASPEEEEKPMKKKKKPGPASKATKAKETPKAAAGKGRRSGAREELVFVEPTPQVF